jgi:hypothetical protein
MYAVCVLRMHIKGKKVSANKQRYKKKKRAHKEM